MNYLCCRLFTRIIWCLQLTLLTASITYAMSTFTLVIDNKFQAVIVHIHVYIYVYIVHMHFQVPPAPIETPFNLTPAHLQLQIPTVAASFSLAFIVLLPTLPCPPPSMRGNGKDVKEMMLPIFPNSETCGVLHTRGKRLRFISRGST